MAQWSNRVLTGILQATIPLYELSVILDPRLDPRSKPVPDIFNRGSGTGVEDRLFVIENPGSLHFVREDTGRHAGRPLQDHGLFA